ncbi:hypothetical protein [Leptolyngbya sp. FACHB-261]|uniref:hypothetical protein n=1 Tax=Leptolyngbya sp. FACHB-261 TaxID=2692806 RepID=UPI0016825768|nr:hypothetical protein [Leptolyngbya sp. FACHB-261]MBD2101009.1 hypothetical protein [Leptolyngbya sp. FACHB-261]
MELLAGNYLTVDYNGRPIICVTLDISGVVPELPRLGFSIRTITALCGVNIMRRFAYWYKAKTMIACSHHYYEGKQAQVPLHRASIDCTQFILPSGQTFYSDYIRCFKGSPCNVIDVADSYRLCMDLRDEPGRKVIDLKLLNHFCDTFKPAEFYAAAYSSLGLTVDSRAIEVYCNQAPVSCPELIHPSMDDTEDHTESMSRMSEESVADALYRREGGTGEIKTKAGHIDLLTQTEVIEVKAVESWRGAIGQALVYALDFPNHTPRIHLFGPVHPDSKCVVEHYCKLLNVRVTWESEVISY